MPAIPSESPRILMVIQPTVSHYRAPLIRRLLESDRCHFDLMGRYTNVDERNGQDRIASAEESVRAHVREVKSTSWGTVRWEKGVVSSVLKGQYDAYVLEGRVYTASTWLALLVGKARGLPVYLWGHGWKRPEGGWKLRFRRSFYSLSAGLLLYGYAARDYAMKVGIPARKMAVVGNSIYANADIASAPPRVLANGEGAEPFRIVASSRLTSRHRLDLLASALQRMPTGPTNRPVSLVVIGDGSERGRLETLFAEAGVAVNFVGSAYGAEMIAPYYAAADVAVSPRASGLNIVQAMGFGVPVIAPDDDPTSGPESELVVDGETGYKFRLDDVEDMAAKLIDARDSPKYLNKMGMTARDRVLKTHTAEQHAKAIEDAIVAWLDANK